MESAPKGLTIQNWMKKAVMSWQKKRLIKKEHLFIETKFHTILLNHWIS